MTKNNKHSDQHTSDLQQENNVMADNGQQSTDNPLQQQLEQYKAQSQRALADYANLKKRYDKERLEISAFVSESIVAQLLPSLDNLDRAMQYASTDEQKSALFQGLSMTMTQLHDVFANLGVAKIEANPGQDFDPHFHEAVDSVAGPQGKIVAQLQLGYQLNTKVIRPAQVTVGNGQTSH